MFTGLAWMVETSTLDIMASLMAIIASGSGAYYYFSEARLKNAERRKLEREDA